MQKKLIFFRIIYVAMSNNQFSDLHNVQMTCQTISTKVSFKITIRKRHVYIEIGWLWIWNQCFYFGIWNNNRSKMIIFRSFQLATRLNSQNQMKLILLLNSHTLICLWILVFPIGIIEFSTSRKCCFWLYFSSLQNYWPRSTWNSVVHTSWGEMERREKRAFQLLKLRKKKYLKQKPSA